MLHGLINSPPLALICSPQSPCQWLTRTAPHIRCYDICCSPSNRSLPPPLIGLRSLVAPPAGLQSAAVPPAVPHWMPFEQDYRIIQNCGFSLMIMECKILEFWRKF
ncbi:hypothetical protein HanRHA438_Chr11g0493621 [Helianthus annuus]|nr:hypothetical protein HanRHA438_Chr11g0493621 [Helianthus annuus]